MRNATSAVVCDRNLVFRREKCGVQKGPLSESAVASKYQGGIVLYRTFDSAR